MADPKTLDQWLYELQAPGRSFAPEDLRTLRDALALRRRPATEWIKSVRMVQRGEGPNAPPPDSDPVTQDETVLTLLVGMNDLLYFQTAALEDMQGRLTRMETFLEVVMPQYAEWARECRKRALVEAS